LTDWLAELRKIKKKSVFLCLKESFNDSNDTADLCLNGGGIVTPQILSEFRGRGFLEINSKVLGCTLYLVRPQSRNKGPIKCPDPALARYALKEITALQGLDKEQLKQMHSYKVLFDGSISLPDAKGLKARGDYLTRKKSIASQA